ncbi:MAG: aldehyde ferredoxin oxidoreductase N-terminal domain-containing protein, partial [Planctomycetota bacterium]|nr:aldehyde ferredoxin oxidoreductase N-terminal domain-containing protein [Planctomycetota bacterium]
MAAQTIGSGPTTAAASPPTPQSAMSLYAYHQRILIVDASSAASRIVELPNQMLSDVIGGTGLATLLALATDQATAEPGSPESAVIFSFSPLVGSPLTT